MENVLYVLMGAEASRTGLKNKIIYEDGYFKIKGSETRTGNFKTLTIKPTRWQKFKAKLIMFIIKD